MIVLLILICTLVIVIKFTMLKLPNFQPACYGTSNGSEVNQQASDVRASSPDFKCVGSSRLPFPPVSSNSRHPLKQNPHVKVDNTCQYTQINQYLLKRSIGQGSYGIVQLAHDTLNNVDYAMKIMSRKKLLQKGGFFGRQAPQRNKFAKKSGTISHPLDRLRREIAVLQKVDHPNVVKLVEVLDDPAQDNLYLVFELLELGPVADVPNGNRIEETQARKYFRDLLLGIEYLHRNHIVHRDVKPANLLVGRDGRLRIADFGVCTEFCGSEDVLLDNTVGTPAFVAPEQLTGQFYGKAADIWAMGITLYVLIYGILPFSGTNVLALYESIRNQELSFPGVQDSTSALLTDLLTRLLCKDPSQRITVSEIKEHPWVDSRRSFRKENCVSETDGAIFVEGLLPEVFSVPYFASLVKSVFSQHSV
ncbi:Uncharacterized protein APZ42_021144 [Daphnia magna]|uniref:Uncharacterized protein n=1 Tax=Daphnia magna TaxID=35525 RepID=A0A0P5E968_9CRUS|nr:Uncharacterized protein APZ42_021144 [Daphnia magna]